MLAVHPRTRAALAASGFTSERVGRLQLVPAVGYLESLALVHGAAAGAQVLAASCRYSRGIPPSPRLATPPTAALPVLLNEPSSRCGACR